MMQIMNDPDFLPIMIIYIIILLIIIWQKLIKFILPLTLILFFSFFIKNFKYPNENYQTRDQQNQKKIENNDQLIVPEKQESVNNILPVDSTVFIQNKQQNDAIKEIKKNLSSPSIKINKLVMCEFVNDSLRIPEQTASEFPSSIKRVYCFAGIKNLADKRNIKFEWYFKDQLLEVNSNIINRSDNWRSWTYKSISSDQIGKWFVVIRDELSNSPLDTIYFKITK